MRALLLLSALEFFDCGVEAYFAFDADPAADFALGFGGVGGGRGGFFHDEG